MGRAFELIPRDALATNAFSFRRVSSASSCWPFCDGGNVAGRYERKWQLQ